MMKCSPILLISLLLILIPFLSVNKSFEQDNKYSTPLTGMEEVPPVNTNSTGIALFEIMNNNIGFQVNVTNLNNITVAQIHLNEYEQLLYYSSKCYKLE